MTTQISCSADTADPRGDNNANEYIKAVRAAAGRLAMARRWNKGTEAESAALRELNELRLRKLTAQASEIVEALGTIESENVNVGVVASE